jgi:hypothetical protein
MLETSQMGWELAHKMRDIVKPEEAYHLADAFLGEAYLMGFAAGERGLHDEAFGVVPASGSAVGPGYGGVREQRLRDVAQPGNGTCRVGRSYPRPK